MPHVAFIDYNKIVCPKVTLGEVVYFIRISDFTSGDACNNSRLHGLPLEQYDIKYWGTIKNILHYLKAFFSLTITIFNI